MPDWMQPFVGELDWPTNVQIVRVVAAVLLGGLVGLEREVRDKPAGFRTIILISLGACLFTMISERVGGADWDTTRIAAQIVSGIGFLGAGAILRDRRAVYGMTTAATIWSVAAIGMACGFGQLGMATCGTIAILIALFAFDTIEHWIGSLRDIQDYHIVTANKDAPFQRIDAVFKSARLQIRKRKCYEDENQVLVFRIVAMGGKSRHDQLHQQLSTSPDYTLKRA